MNIKNNGEEFDIDEKGIEATKKIFKWINGNQDSTVIKNIEDFIKLTTPIIKGRPRAKAIITNRDTSHEVSLQVGKHYYCLPKKDGLDKYDEYEIALKGKDVHSYFDIYYTYGENIYLPEDIDDDEWYVLKNVPRDEAKIILGHDCLFLDDYETAINILEESEKQLKELGEKGKEIRIEIFKEDNKFNQIIKKIEETKTVVTHFGDDLDNKASVFAIENFAIQNGILKPGEHLIVERVPAGKIKEGYLNVDTGGHKGSKFDEHTVVIDGNPEEGIQSAAAELDSIGIDVPEQIVELADIVPNKVSPLESRTALSLIRSASGEQIFKIAEAGLLDKVLTDEQLEQYGLVEAQAKQQQIIDNAVEKVNKYTQELITGEKVVIAPEQILAGAQVAYELGVNYYASVQTHKSGKGSTFAVTSKPGVQLPEEIKKMGQELVDKYKDEKDGTSGVFLNPNGQMLVAGGMKNPDFFVDYTSKELIEKLNKNFEQYETEYALEILKDSKLLEIAEIPYFEQKNYIEGYAKNKEEYKDYFPKEVLNKFEEYDLEEYFEENYFKYSSAIEFLMQKEEEDSDRGKNLDKLLRKVKFLHEEGQDENYEREFHIERAIPVDVLYIPDENLIEKIEKWYNDSEFNKNSEKDEMESSMKTLKDKNLREIIEHTDSIYSKFDRFEPEIVDYVDNLASNEPEIFMEYFKKIPLEDFLEDSIEYEDDIYECFYENCKKYLSSIDYIIQEVGENNDEILGSLNKLKRKIEFWYEYENDFGHDIIRDELYALEREMKAPVDVLYMPDKEIINDIEKLYNKEQRYTVEKIIKGIKPREGEIEKIINETNELARKNDREETIKQEGQTQADE